MSLFFNTNGHLTSEAIVLLKQNKLMTKDKISALEHIGNCEECAFMLSSSFCKIDLVKEPIEFEKTTMNKLNNIKLQKQPSRNNRQFWGYTFRVGLAMCATLILVFTGIFDLTAGLKSNNIPTPDLTFMDTFTQDIKTFSDKIINLEVMKNDQEKK